MSLMLASGLARSQVHFGDERECKGAHVRPHTACRVRVRQARPALCRRQLSSRQLTVDAAPSSALSSHDDRRDTAELAAEPAHAVEDSSPTIGIRLAGLGVGGRFCCVAFAVSALLWTLLPSASQAASAAVSSGGSGGFSITAAAKGEAPYNKSTARTVERRCSSPCKSRSPPTAAGPCRRRIGVLRAALGQAPGRAHCGAWHEHLRHPVRHRLRRDWTGGLTPSGKTSAAVLAEGASA